MVYPRTLSPLAFLALAALGAAQSTTARAIAPSVPTITHTGSGENSATNTSAIMGQYTSRAYASYGVLKAYATAVSGFSSEFDYLRNTVATAGFTDSLTLHAADPALEGTSGALTFRYKLDGALAASGGGSSDDYYHSTARFLISRGGLTNFDDVYGDGSFYSDGGAPSYADARAHGDNVFGTHVETIGFTFGQSFNLALSITAGAYVYLNHNMTATSDLEHTALWGGFDSVTDGNGHALGYSLSSLSGHDWTQPSTEPVPEPSALAALGLGALGLVGRRSTVRRRHRTDGDTPSA